MKKHLRLVMTCCALGAGGLGFALASVLAVDRFWNNVNGGNWNLGSNWNPVGVPGPTDRAFITLNGTYGVSLDVNPTIISLTLGAATGTQTIFTNGLNITLNGPSASAINLNGVYQDNHGATLNNLSGVALANSGSMLFNIQGSIATIQGPVSNLVGGLIRATSDSSSSGIVNFNPGSTFVNDGILRVEANVNQIVLNISAGTLVNNGTIQLQSSAIGPPNVFDTGTLINNGMIEAQGGSGALVELAAVLDNFGTLLNNGSLTINSAGAAHVNRAAGVFQINTSALTINLSGFGQLNNLGLITINPAGALAFSSGVFANSQGGQLTATGPITTNNTLVSNAGTISCSGAGTWSSTVAGLTNQAPGVMNVAASITTSNAALSNFGTINLQTGGIISPTGSTFTNQASGILKGVGTITTSGTTFTNHGTISPGDNSIGTFHINGPYTQSSTGRVQIEINGNTPGTQYDVLQVLGGGTATIDGTLNVSLGNGFLPAVNSTFNVLTSTSLVNTFDVAYFPGFPDARVMTVAYGAQNAVVTVQLLEDLLDFGQGPTTSVPTQPTDGALGDFDGDSDPDMAITITSGTSSPGSALVLFNAGTSGVPPVWQGFSGSVQVTVGVDPSGVATGLFDANASLDLAITNRGNGIASGTVTILANNGAGAFATLGAPIAVGVRPSDIASGDMNGTSPAGGDIDLVVVNAGLIGPGNGSLIVLLNQGNGAFNPGIPVATQNNPTSVDPGDVDNDRDLDMVVSNGGSNSVSMYSNNGAGVPLPPVHYPVGANPRDVELIGLDGDGLPEIVTANANGDSVSVLINNPALPGTFGTASHLPVDDNPRSLAVLDADGDGDLDLAVLADATGGDDIIIILRNDTPAPINSPVELTRGLQLNAGENAFIVLSDDLDGLNGDDLLTINSGGALNDDGKGGARGGGGGAFVFSLLNTTQPAPLGYNIDIGCTAAGLPGFGPPTASFGAAANQPGAWSELLGATATSVPLSNLAGDLTSAIFSRDSAVGGNVGQNNANSSRDFALLLEDIQTFVSGTRTYTFTGVAPGRYRVFTYAISPSNTTFRTSVSVAGSTSANPQIIGGGMPPNSFVIGVTHAEHKIIVQPGGGSPITITTGVSVNTATVSGVQLLPRPPCPADFSPAGGNDAVNVDDLLGVINSWGACAVPCSSVCVADVTGNCAVNVDDLLAVINAWGLCP